MAEAGAMEASLSGATDALARRRSLRSSPGRVEGYFCWCPPRTGRMALRFREGTWLSTRMPPLRGNLMGALGLRIGIPARPKRGALNDQTIGRSDARGLHSQDLRSASPPAG